MAAVLLRRARQLCPRRFSLGERRAAHGVRRPMVHDRREQRVGRGIRGLLSGAEKQVQRAAVLVGIEERDPAHLHAIPRADHHHRRSGPPQCAFRLACGAHGMPVRRLGPGPDVLRCARRRRHRMRGQEDREGSRQPAPRHAALRPGPLPGARRTRRVRSETPGRRWHRCAITGHRSSGPWGQKGSVTLFRSHGAATPRRSISNRKRN